MRGVPQAQALWKCRITGYLMELWVTMFAGRGKVVLCFSMSCEHNYP